MKTFIEHELPELEQINTDAGRFYKTPEGKVYPSVTTILGSFSKDGIERWRKAVGEEEADRIMQMASARGTRIHNHCEEYLKTGSTNPSMFDLEAFNAIKPHFAHINNIHCCERRLYSDKLQAAGTADLIAEYDDILTLIDWKTSGRSKCASEIENYFMQCSAYSYFFWERTDIFVNDIKIIMASDDSNKALVFNEKATTWLSKFMDLRKLHKLQFS